MKGKRKKVNEKDGKKKKVKEKREVMHDNTD